MTSLKHLNQPGTTLHDVNGAINDEDEEDDWYHEEMNDISTKKQLFFSSNCKNRETSTHCKEKNQCMKCNEGGQLLICSSESCLFVFHASCLVLTSDTTTENFFCPFCKYSQLISNYRLIKKKTSLARNDVANFNGMALKYTPKMSHERFCASEQIKSCKTLAGPQRRRVPVPWTQLEEDTLKLLVVALQKWMEKVTGGRDEGFVPWRRILELGASVFQKSRTPVDLKDKWRNMQKATKN